MGELQALPLARSVPVQSAELSYPVGSALVAPNQILSPMVILSGWAKQCRWQPKSGALLAYSLYLPGDIVAPHLCEPRGDSVVAMTEVKTRSVDPGSIDLGDLREALSARLSRQAIRATHFECDARVADFLLELHERLSAAGEAQDGSFMCPITQSAIGQLLGMSSVHVNRCLRRLREQELVEIDKQTIRLNIDGLARHF